MKKIYQKLPFHRGWLIVVIVLTGLLATVWLAQELWFEPWVKSRLEKLPGNNLYSLKIQNVDANVFSGTVALRGIKIVTDSVEWEAQRRDSSQGTPLRIQLEMNGLNINGFKWFRYWQHRDLLINSISAIEPRIQLWSVKDSVLEVQPQADTATLNFLNRIPDLLAPHARRVKIGTVAVYNGTFYYQTAHKKDITVQSADSVDWILSNVAIDPSDTTLSGRAFYANTLLLYARHFELYPPGNLYKISIGPLSLHSTDQLLTLRNVAVQTRMTAKKWEDAPPKRARIQFFSPAITIRGLNLFRALHRDEWLASTVGLENPDFELYIDKIFPIPNRKMPHEHLQKISVPVGIDSVFIHQGKVTYRERENGETGVMTFEKLQGTITGVANREPQQPAFIYGQALFMGTGPMRLSVNYPLGSGPFRCTFHAKAEHPDLTNINQFIKNKGGVRIANGALSDLAMSVKVNDGAATGWLQATYAGLRITVLDESSGKKKGLVSGLANLLLRNNNKPNGVRPLERAEVRYERDPRDDFFRFLWQCTKTGLLETILPGNVENLLSNG